MYVAFLYVTLFVNLSKSNCLNINIVLRNHEYFCHTFSMKKKLCFFFHYDFVSFFIKLDTFFILTDFISEITSFYSELFCVISVNQ